MSLPIVNVSLPDRFVDLEIVVVDIVGSRKGRTRVVCGYSVPDANVDMLSDLAECISHTGDGNFNLIVIGDFNLPGVDWENNCLTSSCRREPEHRLFLSLCSYLDLTQQVYFSTHMSGSILDIILTNRHGVVLDATQEEPFTHSCDHNQVSFSITCHVLKTNTFRSVKLYSKGDFSSINTILAQIDWHEVYQSCSTADALYTYLCAALTYCVNLHVPSI